MRHRYESWFHRFQLADNSGAWWLRYLLSNPGQSGRPENSAAPVQVWATWFPRGTKAQTIIGQFTTAELQLSERNEPFVFEVGPNRLGEGYCLGALEAEGRRLSWDLTYQSTFKTTLSNRGWIGFSRTPHSDAIYSGEIEVDGKKFSGPRLGVGLQGHNCGFRHRNFWTWAHACFPQPDGKISTFEALVYDMPFGLVFRKAVMRHRDRRFTFQRLSESARDPQKLIWRFEAKSSDALLQVEIDGSGPSVHRLPYAKTDSNGTFEVLNNSLAQTRVRLRENNVPSTEELTTEGGSVVEMTGSYKS